MRCALLMSASRCLNQQCVIYGNVLFTPVCLSVYAGPSVQYLRTCSCRLEMVKSCWLISWSWLGYVSRFVNSNDIHQCVCSHSVASSFAQNSSACLLHCRPRRFPRSFLQTTAMSYKSRGGQETKEWRNKKQDEAKHQRTSEGGREDHVLWLVKQ